MQRNTNFIEIPVPENTRRKTHTNPKPPFSPTGKSKKPIFEKTKYIYIYIQKYVLKKLSVRKTTVFRAAISYESQGV